MKQLATFPPRFGRPCRQKIQKPPLQSTHKEKLWENKINVHKFVIIASMPSILPRKATGY